MVEYAGKIEEQVIAKYIRPAYDNFDDMSYDVSNAKNIIKDFIVKYCKTERQPNPPDDINMYKMSIYDDYGIVMEIKGYRMITYLIDASSGDVYVAEHIENTTSPNLKYINVLFEISSG